MIAIDSTIVTSRSCIAGMNPPGLAPPAPQAPRPHPVGEPHLFQQPHDSKSPPLAEDDNHLWLLIPTLGRRTPILAGRPEGLGSNRSNRLCIRALAAWATVGNGHIGDHENLATFVILPLDRYGTWQPSRSAIEGSRRAASHLPIVSCNEAIRKTACAILPTKQRFFQCRLIFK